MRKVRYEEMLPHEIVEARTACPVAYLAIGGLEWHGEHNCVGLDTVKAHALTLKCAEGNGGVAMPALFFGEPRESGLMEANYDPDGRIAAKMGLPTENFAAGYMQTAVLDESERYLRLLLHILMELESLGFRVIVLVAGHYPLLHLARAAAEIHNMKWPRPSKAWACTGFELVKDEIPEAGDHAGPWETSLMMALRPDLVDLSRLPAAGGTESLIGIMGRDPRVHSSKEFGERGVAAIIKRVGAKVTELLAQAGK